MGMLPFGSLPAYKPRRFVPGDLDFGNWERIEPCFDLLEAQGARCKTGAELEGWLLNWSELTAALDEEGAKRYIAMTCDTEDPEIEKAYLHFVEHIEPKVKPRQFRQELKLLDLANRKGKAPGGYQSTLAEARLPFIFMNAVGIQRDVETIFHEGGHAFHALASRDEDLYAYRNPPIEFCEVASMSMELLGNEFLPAFYPISETKRARRTHLESVLNVLPWVATVDAFQHWVYTHPGHSRQERREAWTTLMDRFGGEVDWSGDGSERANLWHRQLHIFLYPLYYIEYAIAQLGALQVWTNSKRDSSRALREYKQALRLGASRPLPELFAAAGCRFHFGRETMAPLMNMLHQELVRLDQTPA